LPDGKVGQIRDLATPALRANDYSTGLFTADLAIAQAAAAAHGVAIDGVPAGSAPNQLRGDDDDLRGVLGIAAVLGIVLMIGLIGRRRRDYDGRGRFRGVVDSTMVGGMVGERDLDGGGDGGGGFGGFGGGSGGGGGAGGSF
jgi:uncharacterized protein